MLDLLIIYDVEGWAYHYRALALARHAPSDFRVRLAAFNRFDPATEDEHGVNVKKILGDTAPDVIFILCRHEVAYLRQTLLDRGWPTRLVASWNTGWPDQRQAFHALLQQADRVIVNNKEFWEQAGRLPQTHHISNGVELQTFRLTRPPEIRSPRVLWCGSAYHRCIKGYDDYIVPLFERLRAEGIECEARLSESRAPDRLDPDEMAQWYNEGTILVVASETEGTPNTALEAAACGCTVVSTRVGNMPELLRHNENGIVVDRDLEDLYEGVRQAVTDYIRLTRELQRDICQWDWAIRSKQFFRVFREAVAVNPDFRVPVPDLRPDLSAEMTVYVSTVGAASFHDCLAHLKCQDCRFRLQVIENVSPMSTAFQFMLDQCQTPYYIQVDEDMILKPWAVRALHHWIRSAPPDVALVAAWLWDVHLGLEIQAVKAYRHEIVRRYPYANVQSCEKNQLHRLREDGYRHMLPQESESHEYGAWTLGLHGTHYDPQTIYERYSTLMQRMRHHPVNLAWFSPYAGEFLDRFLSDPCELNLMALMGLLAGRLTEGSPGGEKDFNRYAESPGLLESRAFYAAHRRTSILERETSGDE